MTQIATLSVAMSRTAQRPYKMYIGEVMKPFLSLCLIISVIGCASAPQEISYGKTGTQRPYKINGKWYHPIESTYSFEEEGYASWYGSDFHGKKTSNGEVYNMHAMTAAHKILPMGTYVKVIRLDNGRETIVKINDRGPFVKDRIIDLSYKAASELGITDTGVAEVKLVALGEIAGDKLITRDYEKGNFLVQVGAFTIKDNAVRMKGRLQPRYKNTFITTFERNGTLFYRVRIGGLMTLKDAERLKARLEEENFESPFVVAE